MGHSDKHGAVPPAEASLTRRRTIATSAALFAGGLAGCSGGDGDDGASDGTGGGAADGSADGSSGDETTITTFMQAIPGEMNFNTWAPSYPWTPSWLLLEPVVRFYADGSVSTEIVSEDWTYDEETREATVPFTDDFYWWNGDQVTAADKYWYEAVARRLNPEASAVEQLALEDNGQTLVRTYKDQQNPQLLEYQLGGYLGAMLRGHRDSFRPWAEELADASTSEERTDIEERMAEEMPLNIETVMADGLGNGPFRIVDYDEQGIYCELHDRHPYADDIGIDRLEYLLAADEAVAQNIVGGEYDFGFGPLANWIGDNEPDHVETIGEYQDTFMRKLEFMMQGPGSKHVRNLQFRRALAHVIDLEHVSTNNASESTPRTLQSGLPENVTAEWLGDTVSDFLDYPTQADASGAAELLEGEGYQQDGDVWIGPDGEQVSLEVVVAAHNQNPARTVTDQLTQFGFDVNMSSLEGATYNDRTEDSVDFDLTIESHGSLTAHPSYYFRPTHTSGNDLGEEGVVVSALDEGRERSPYNGKQLVVEIPETVGQEDRSGSTVAVNLYERYQEWTAAQTDERNREIASTFSWFWNFYLPGIDMYEEVNASWGKTDEWSFDVNEEWEAYRGAYRALKRGYISPN